jgi:hypothetical protein
MADDPVRGSGAGQGQASSFWTIAPSVAHPDAVAQRPLALRISAFRGQAFDTACSDCCKQSLDPLEIPVARHQQRIDQDDGLPRLGGLDADPAHDREPVAVFTGEVLPLYAGDLDDDTVRAMLNELASEIGGILEQEEVYVSYRDRTWTLKRQ